MPDTKETHVPLEYKPDWDQCAERYQAFWDGEIIDRPLIQAFAKKSTNETVPKGWWRILDEKAWNRPEQTIREVLEFFERTHFGGDAYPMWFPNLGPGAITAFMGNPIHFDDASDTSWQEHGVLDYARLPFDLDAENPVWVAVQRLTKLIAELSPGRFVAGVCDLGLGADALAAIGGSEQLCLDLLEEPDLVKARLAKLRIAWEKCYGTLFSLLPANNGSCCWLPAWSPGKTYPLQNDFSYMISAEMFREFFLEDLAAHCAMLDHPIYHLDGVGAVKHLDAILEIPSLRAIQWTPGPGNPLCNGIPMLKKIQDAGKGVFVYAAPNDLDALMESLSPKGIIVNLWASSPEEAEALVAKTFRWAMAR